MANSPDYMNYMLAFLHRQDESSQLRLWFALKLFLVELGTAALIGLQAAGTIELPAETWGVIGAINVGDAALLVGLMRTTPLPVPPPDANVRG